jgi:endonuclease/exonuclease/phosphatase family metal-dependent hydrolase
MRIMSYNVHSCVGTDGLRSPARIAETIAESGADIVALQELDHRRARSEHIHQAQVIAEELAMHFHFAPAMRVAGEEYGDAILSRHPLTVVRAEALPTVESGWCLETRGALWVSVEAGEIPWQVLNTHFGLGRAERFAQAQALLGPAWLGAAAESPPVVICGDFNSQAGGRVHRLLAKPLRDTQGDRHRATFPSRFPLLCLDYIFVGQGVAVTRVEIPRTALTRVASDHLPLIADVAFTAVRATARADEVPLPAIARSVVAPQNLST